MNSKRCNIDTLFLPDLSNSRFIPQLIFISFLFFREGFFVAHCVVEVINSSPVACGPKNINIISDAI